MTEVAHSGHVHGEAVRVAVIDAQLVFHRATWLNHCLDPGVIGQFHTIGEWKNASEAMTAIQVEPEALALPPLVSMHPRDSSVLYRSRRAACFGENCVGTGKPIFMVKIRSSCWAASAAVLVTRFKSSTPSIFASGAGRVAIQCASDGYVRGAARLLHEQDAVFLLLEHFERVGIIGGAMATSKNSSCIASAVALSMGLLYEDATKSRNGVAGQGICQASTRLLGGEATGVVVFEHSKVWSSDWNSRINCTAASTSSRLL